MKLNLDLTQVQAQTGGLADLVPEGTYTVKIASVEGKPTSAGTGHYLELAMTIQDGQFTGRTLVERLNVQNPNSEAVRIALSTLKGILTVGGHANPNMLVDTDDMIKLRPFSVFVTQEKSQSGDKEYTNNRIKKYKVFEGVMATQAAVPPVITSQVAAPVAAPQATAAFPWGQPK